MPSFLGDLRWRDPCSPSQFTGQMHDLTGKYPAFWSGDFLFEADDIAHRQTMIDQAKTEWSHGAVVQLMFHACAPDATEPCSWDPGLLHHPLSDAQWHDLITAGGALNRAWKSRLDELVPFLQQLQDDGIAPLFRPHHEMNQGAFWWGRPPGQGRDAPALPDHARLPGDREEARRHRLGLGRPGPDLGLRSIRSRRYDAMVKVSPHRPIAIGECERLPTSTELLAQPKWTFFMGWSELVAEGNTADAIKALFGAPNVLTLDEMPAH